MKLYILIEDNVYLFDLAFAEKEHIDPHVRDREMKERWKNIDKILYVDQECQFQMLFPCKWHFDRGNRDHIKATNKTGELTACSDTISN